MTAKEGLKYISQVIAEQDEPIFILRGRDFLAPLVVLEWARAAEVAGVGEDKICSAISVARAMMKWKYKRLPD